MRDSPTQLAILVGAAAACDDVRRGLVQRNVPHAGLARDIASLRRLLHRAAPDLSVLCVALDDATLDRHADSLVTLLRDARGFPGSIRSIGIAVAPNAWPLQARLGFDLHAATSADASRLIDTLVLKTGSRARSPSSVRFAELMLEPCPRRLLRPKVRRFSVPPDSATEWEGQDPS